jgi:hypothetical protein
MNKTVKELFNELPPEIRKRAIANVVKQHGMEKLDERYSGLQSTINHTMHWAETPEGEDFWVKVHDGYYDADCVKEVLASGSFIAGSSDDDLLLTI